MEKNITFYNDENSTHQIYGIIHQPKYVKKYIIFCGGLNGDRIDIHRIGVQFGRHAEAKGFSVIRFDYRGHGISSEEFIDTSYQSKLEDIEIIIDSLDINIPIVLLGFSDGAKLALTLSKKYYTRIEKLVLWSPLLVSNPYNNQIGNLTISKERLYGKIGTDVLGMWFGVPYFKGIKEHFKFIQTDIETLLIVGENDPLIRSSVNEFESKNSCYTKKIIIDANHVYSHEDWKEEVFYTTLKFLLK